MPIQYGIAGSDPLRDLERSLHLLLEDAVKAKWDLYSDVVDATTVPVTVYPPASKIWFNHKWFDDHHDMTITFRRGNGARPPEMRSIDWSVIHVTDYVDIHIWSRSATFDEPDYHWKMIRILMHLIEAERTDLVPNVVFTVVSDRSATEEVAETKTFHHIVSVRAVYKIRRVVLQ